MVDTSFFFVVGGLGLLSIIAPCGILLWWFLSGRARGKRTLGVALTLAVTVGGGAILAMFLLDPPVKRDLSLDGGYTLTLLVDGKVDDEGMRVNPDQGGIEQAIETIRGRLGQVGHEDALVQGLGGARIRVEVYGAAIDDAEVMERVVVKPAKLELRLVHPESASKAPMVREGEAIVPGYQHHEYRYTTHEGENLSEDLLLSKRVQVEGKHVKYAAADASQPGVVNIRLNGEGGDRMILLTRNLNVGRDRIAVMLDDEVMSAPVVNAVPLGASFLIEGLDGHREASDLAAALMNPLEHPVKILEASHVAAVDADPYRAHRVAGSWSRLEYVMGIMIGCGVLVGGVITLAIIALGTGRTPDTARSQSLPDIPTHPGAGDR